MKSVRVDDQEASTIVAALAYWACVCRDNPDAIVESAGEHGLRPDIVLRDYAAVRALARRFQ